MSRLARRAAYPETQSLAHPERGGTLSVGFKVKTIQIYKTLSPKPYMNKSRDLLATRGFVTQSLSERQLLSDSLNGELRDCADVRVPFEQLTGFDGSF